jgi:hypothetical protein
LIRVSGRDDSHVGYVNDDTIRGWVRTLSAQMRHVLLVSDSCFSGQILRRSRERAPPPRADFANLQSDAWRKSVRALTSGRDTERVPNESTFARAVAVALTDNRSRFLRAEDLSHEVSSKVRETVTGQKPQFGVIQDAGHEFGQFIFVLRRSSDDSREIPSKEPPSPAPNASPSADRERREIPSSFGPLGVVVFSPSADAWLKFAALSVAVGLVAAIWKLGGLVLGAGWRHVDYAPAAPFIVGTSLGLAGLLLLVKLLLVMMRIAWSAIVPT